MPPQRLLVLGVLVPLWAVAPAAASAQEAATDEAAESIDDPKLERRLGERIELAPSDAGPAAGSELVTPLPSDGAATTLVEPATRASAARLTPWIKVAYRRFTFAQVGAKGTTGAGPSEPFDVLSLDLYPVSSAWRFGVTAQYGWQEGTFRQDGDAFVAGALSLGGQIPGPVVTPFLEAYGGGGLMQRTTPELGLTSIATAFGEWGIDAGAEVFMARHLCLSLAFGWVHLANGYARGDFETFSVDTWSFKIGMGL